MIYLPDDLIWLVNQLIPSVVITLKTGERVDNFNEHFNLISVIELFSDLIIKPNGNTFENLKTIIYNGYTISLEGNCNKLFYGRNGFNQPLDRWDVSNVQSMDWMFKWCFDFNQSINCWSVRNVQSMLGMFYGCYEFNQPLNNWPVSLVESTGLNIL